MLQAMLGAFLITKDSIENVGREKPKKGVKSAAKKNVPSPYAMLALAKNDQIPCISCGYPTLRGFAPEKHRRFDRMQTCSWGCFHILAHYKEMDESSLQTKTVKKITDAMKAASAYTIRTLRHANGEEVAMSTSPAEAARRNLRHIAALFLVIQKYAWNGTKTVGGKCNKQLMDAKSFDGIVPHTPVMGHWCHHYYRQTGQ